MLVALKDLVQLHSLIRGVLQINSAGNLELEKIGVVAETLACGWATPTCSEQRL